MKRVLQSLILLVAITICHRSLAQFSIRTQPITIFKEDFTGTIKSISTPLGPQQWTYSQKVPSNISKSSGVPYLGASGNSNIPNVFTLSQEISTLGYKNITILWTGKRNKDVKVKLQYSTNGVDFVELPSSNFTDVVVGSSESLSSLDWKFVNNGVPISLPEQLSNVHEVKFRWYFVTAGNASYAIDDIVISGVPLTGTSTFYWSSRQSLGEDPCKVSAATNNPYIVDDVVMTWSKVIPAGIQATTTVSTAFNPRKAMLISQKGAISNVGGVYTLKFNKTVHDLTFTLIDVDFINNSNDDIIIKGYSGNKLVYAPKEKVQCTAINTFDANMGRALAGKKEVVNTNDGGDVSFTFKEGVDRVELTFYNSNSYDYAGTSSGEQGIGISDITWRTDDPVALPVTLVSFDAKKEANGVKLEWATASEINNERFVVEKSYDAKTFVSIGEVQGKGNSNVLQKYSFLDYEMRSGVAYYRLTQYDYDQKFESSKIISITNKDGLVAKSLKLYPNPTAIGQVAVQLTQSLDQAQTFYVLNTAGVVVRTVELLKSNVEVSVPIEDLPAGIYIVKAEDGELGTSRFIKL